MSDETGMIPGYTPLTIEDYERRYLDNPDSAMTVARERIEEWDYARDPHGYCHERPMIMSLLAEIERLRGATSRLTSRT